MTLRSELVLHDCYYAIDKYNPADQGEDFRLKWWTIVSLLRAVGHVLYHVDRNISDKHRKIIDQEFECLKSTKPKPEIYWLFIETERNNFLKEYKHGVTQQFISSHVDEGIKKTITVGFTDLQSFRVAPAYPNSTRQESFINDGPYKGRNEIEVAKLAANWWYAYLSNIKIYIDRLV